MINEEKFRELQQELTYNTIREIISSSRFCINQIKLIDNELLQIKIKMDNLQVQYTKGRVTISFGKTEPKFLIYHCNIITKDPATKEPIIYDGKTKRKWSKTYCTNYITLRLKNKTNYLDWTLA